MRAVLRLAVVVLACGALVVGCGGGDSGGRDAETVIEDEDQRLAEGALLTLADFPSGWEEPADEDGEDGEDEDESACFQDIAPDLSELTVTGHAESGNFETETAWASSAATVYRSEDEARAAFEGGRDALQSDELAECFRDAFVQGLAEGENDAEIEVGELSTREATAPETAAERSAAVDIEIPLEVEGEAVSAYMEFVGLQQGRSIGSLVTFSFIDPFPADETGRLAGIMVDRLGG